MADAKRKIDWAPTLADAVAMRDMYLAILRDIPAFDNWLVGFEKDPIPVHHVHGYVIYAKPSAEKPAEPLPEQRSKPPTESLKRHTAGQRRHPNR